jgi:hypothetical protein
MFARFLGWLRLRPGPVVEQIPPAEAPSSASQVRDLLAQMAEAGHVLQEVFHGQMALERADRNQELLDLVFDVRKALGIPPGGLAAPLVRPSVPVIPGRTS